MFESQVEASVLLVLKLLFDISNIHIPNIVFCDDEFRFMSIFWKPNEELFKLVTHSDLDFLISLNKHPYRVFSVTS